MNKILIKKKGNLMINLHKLLLVLGEVCPNGCDEKSRGKGMKGSCARPAYLCVSVRCEHLRHLRQAIRSAVLRGPL